MLINVRGGLGMQIIDAMGGLARCIEKGIEPEGILVNTGGVIASHCQQNFIGSLFTAPFPIETADSINKSNSWNIETFNLILEHRNTIVTRYLSLIPRADYVVPGKALHVRLYDRQLVSTDRYVRFAQDHKLTAIGQFKYLAPSFTEQFPVVLRQTDIRDWYSLFYAKEVYGALSSYTISMLLLNPTKHLRVFSQQLSDGPHHMQNHEFEHAAALFEKVPNAKWITTV